MANVRSYFSGNFLKAEECKGGEIVEILTEGELEEIQTPDGKTKSVLNYNVAVNGQEKKWTPNQTNGNILISAFGDDDAKWVGKKFKVTLAKISVFGKVKNSIVAEPLAETAAPTPIQKP